MSVVLRTSDNSVKVVSERVACLSAYIQDILTLHPEEVPVPLTDAEYDLWLALAIQMDSKYLQEWHCSYDEVTLLSRMQLLPIVRLMNMPDRWVLYCVPDCYETFHSTTEDSASMYESIGRVVRDGTSLTSGHPMFGSCLLWLDGARRSYELDLREELDTVAGIAYCDWLVSRPAELLWSSISWHTIVDLQLEGVASYMMGVSNSLYTHNSNTFIRIMAHRDDFVDLTFAAATDDPQVHNHWQLPIVEDPEYQRRLCIWYKKQLAHYRVHESTNRDTLRMLFDQSGIQQLVLGSEAPNVTTMSIRSNAPAYSKREVLSLYVDFCTKLMEDLWCSSL